MDASYKWWLFRDCGLYFAPETERLKLVKLDFDSLSRAFLHCFAFLCVFTSSLWNLYFLSLLPYNFLLSICNAPQNISWWSFASPLYLSFASQNLIDPTDSERFKEFKA